MFSVFHLFTQIRARIEGTRIWEVATKSKLRIVCSVIALIVAMMIALVFLPGLLPDTPFGVVIYLTTYVAISALISLFMSEAKRRWNW